jgi:hypothetical protein
MRWAKLGGENTKFFHRIATKSLRSNFIAHIKTEDDRIVCDHEEKASVIWHSFKERVGQSNEPNMLLTSLILFSTIQILISLLLRPHSPLKKLMLL